MPYTKCRLTPNVVFHISVDASYDFVYSGATHAWVAIFSPDFVMISEVVALSIRKFFSPYYFIFSAFTDLVLLG